MKYKFKMGDKVKIVLNGSGCGSSALGHIVTISECGDYSGSPGYRILETTLQTNSEIIGGRYSGYDGFIGEISFELAEEAVPNFLIFN